MRQSAQPLVPPSLRFRSVSFLEGSMPSIFDSPDEAVLHAEAIDALAAEIGRPVVEIRPVYESVYRRLRTQARITDYLPLLVSRHTRAALKGAAQIASS